MIAVVIVALLAGVAVGAGLCRVARFRHTFRGIHVLTCPESRQSAAVELACWQAAVAGLFGKPVPRVRSCSRWPERRNCDQACVKAIEDAPAATLIQTILADWCRYNACICCRAPLAKLHVARHEPHLIDREFHIFEWKDIPPEKVPEALRACEPVCHNCLVAETHTW
jgi:hypothetical protein